MSKTNESVLAVKVSVITIIINLVLSVFKLSAGILSHSGAMISDAVHSASDVFSTFIVIIGIKISQRQSDAGHPYGHERMECIASMILSMLLFLTGFGIGWKGLTAILSGQYESLKVPGMLALFAAVISIITKEAMYWYTRNAAKKINSGALLADAWHHRSDALSSVGAFIGIVASRLGYPVMDSVASVIICLFIFKAAYDIFKDAIDKLVDKSCDTETIEAMSALIQKQEHVIRLDEIRTRIFASKIYVDVEIAVDGSLPLYEAHEIAQRVHDKIEQNFSLVKHCMVHVNPA